MGGELKTYVYVGSGDWSEQEDGLVTVYEMKRATKELAYVSEHPAGGLASFLAIDEQRGRLFVADEVDGGVISFSIDRQTGKLTELGATTSANHPVYLALTPDGASLLAANYAEGSVDVYPLGADGLALASTETRITGTSTHCVALIAGNNVLVANKDSDTLSHFHLDGGLLSLGSPETTAVTSPRHITYGPDGRAYVVSEEADLLSAYDVASEGALSLAWQEPRLAAGGVAATDTGGDIHVTPSGSFLYASNRGNSNTIVGYDLRESPPRLIGHTPSQGTTPRNFALDPQEEFLVVGNHGSQKSLATFSIADDGSLELAELMPLSISPFFVGVVQFASP